MHTQFCGNRKLELRVNQPVEEKVSSNFSGRVCWRLSCVMSCLWIMRSSVRSTGTPSLLLHLLYGCPPCSGLDLDGTSRISWRSAGRAGSSPSPSTTGKENCRRACEIKGQMFKCVCVCRCLWEAVAARYLTSERRQQRLENLSEYFLGRWSGKLKPVALPGLSLLLSDRKVPPVYRLSDWTFLLLSVGGAMTQTLK